MGEDLTEQVKNLRNVKWQMLRGVLLPLSSCYPLPISQCSRNKKWMLIIWLSPEIHFPLSLFPLLPDTHTSCSNPPPLPPAFIASSSHLLLFADRVPNEAPWECSLAPSLKIGLLALCCFGGAAGRDCLPFVPYGQATPALMQQTHSDHALTLFFKLVCTVMPLISGDEHM